MVGCCWPNSICGAVSGSPWRCIMHLAASAHPPIYCIKPCTGIPHVLRKVHGLVCHQSGFVHQSLSVDRRQFSGCHFLQGHATRHGEQIRQSPLDLLHSVLQNIASRLLLNQVILDLKHLLAAPSPWAGRIRREATRAFKIGVRCVCAWLAPVPLQSVAAEEKHCHGLPALLTPSEWCRIPFWVGVPCVCSDDLDMAGTSAGLGPALAQSDQGMTSPRGMPLVELGIDAAGALGVGIPKAWLPIYPSAASPGTPCILDC